MNEKTKKGAGMMNEKFYALPLEKQDAIIHAGYRVFSQNGYKKSPMQEIADEAGISKSLLFHYFLNKKELYLFLWEHACQYSIEKMTEAGCYEETDFFRMLYRGMKVKLDILRENPNMGVFVIKAYYEKDPDVHDEIQASYSTYYQMKAELSLRSLPKDQFRVGIDKNDIFTHIFWEANGYLTDKLRSEILDISKLEKDFSNMIRFWKKIYGKER